MDIYKFVVYHMCDVALEETEIQTRLDYLVSKWYLDGILFPTTSISGSLACDGQGFIMFGTTRDQKFSNCF